MSEVILHHYPASPFAEKVRLMLGFKGLAWRSVTIPRWMPKPDLTALTGGYRRTPVMQIGADVFCDSACIARELERLRPGPALFPAREKGRTTVMGAWADRTLFFDVVGVVFGTHGHTAPQELRDDRHRFSGGAIDIDRYAADQTHIRAQLRAHLFWLENALEDGCGFLLGDTPTYADFCVWGPVWMLRNRVPELGLLDDTPRVRAWVERMGAFGHGAPAEFDAKDALRTAREAVPRPVEPTHPELPAGMEIGQRVTVAADDYGKEPVTGYLVACSAQRVILRRGEPAAGEVNVHFPRAGFRLTQV